MLDEETYKILDVYSATHPLPSFRKVTFLSYFSASMYTVKKNFILASVVCIIYVLFFRNTNTLERSS